MLRAHGKIAAWPLQTTKHRTFEHANWSRRSGTPAIGSLINIASTLRWKIEIASKPRLRFGYLIGGRERRRGRKSQIQEIAGDCWTWSSVQWLKSCTTRFRQVQLGRGRDVNKTLSHFARGFGRSRAGKAETSCCNLIKLWSKRWTRVQVEAGYFVQFTYLLAHNAVIDV